MLGTDVKHGITVDFEGVEYLVLDRHPKPAHWWLQRKSDGALEDGTGYFYAHPKDMEVVADDYGRLNILPYTRRNGSKGAHVVRGELGEWIISKSSEGWRITHRPSALMLKDFKTRKEADRVMQELHEKIAPIGEDGNIGDQRQALIDIISNN